MSDHDATAKPTGLDRLVDAIVRAVVTARQQSAPGEHDVRWAANTAFAEALEQEIKPLAGDVLKDLGDRGLLPEGLQALLNEVEDPGHQFGWMVQIALFIGAFLGVVPALISIGSQTAKNELWQADPAMPLGVGDAVDALHRGFIDDPTARKIAAQSGVNGTNFDILLQLIGEAPSAMALLPLWRRGIVNDDLLDYTMRFQHIAEEWWPYIKALAHPYMAPIDVIELKIKGLVTDETGKEMFTIAGGLPDQWELLWQGYGNSIGTEEAMTLWNHHLIDEHDVNQVLGRSRINPLFYDIAKKTRHRWLNPHQVEMALKGGSVTPEEATRWLLEDGYPADQVSAFVIGASVAKAAKVKTDTEGMVISQYIDHVLDESEAATALHDLGYSPHEASLILANADAKRAQSQLASAVSVIRHAYLQGHIDKHTASADLDRLEVPAKARDAWLIAWDIERGLSRKSFTMAQVGGFLKKGLIHATEARDRWIAMGYSADDADLLLKEYAPK